MKRQLVAVFLAGVVFSGMLLGAGMYIGSNTSSVEAQADNGGTWHVANFSSAKYLDPILAWVEALPAECDLVISQNEAYYYYRCPDGVTVEDF